MYIKLIIVIIYFVLYSNCYATERTGNQSLKIHGFASQVFIDTDNNNFFGTDCENGSFDFREIGINGSYRVIPDLRISAQVISRKGGGESNSDPKVYYALADYRVIDTAALNAGVRVGRIKLPIGLYNETRDIAHTRNGIVLPNSVYIASFREMFIAGDGGSIYLSSMSRFGQFGFSYNLTDPVISKDGKSELEYLLLSVNDPGEFETNPFKVYKLDYSGPNDFLKLAWTRAEEDLDFKRATGSMVPAGNLDVVANIYSMQLMSEYADFTLEYMLVENMVYGFAPLIPDKVGFSERYYAQFDFRLISSVNLYLRYDVTYKNTADRNGEKYSKKTGKPAHNQFAIDRMIGARWNFDHNLMFGMEYHMIDGTGFLSPQENPDLNATAKEWNMLMLQAAYRF